MAVAQWILYGNPLVVTDEYDEDNAPEITYDSQANAGYITLLLDEEIDNTETVNLGHGVTLNVDLTKDKVIVGVELLFASDMKNRKFPQPYFFSNSPDGISEDWNENQYDPNVIIKFTDDVSVGLYLNYEYQLYSVEIITNDPEHMSVIL